MASYNTLKMNELIPKPTMLMVKEGEPNMQKELDRTMKRTRKGRTYIDETKIKGAFGNKPNKSIPLGYDFTFPKKIRVI